MMRPTLTVLFSLFLFAFQAMGAEHRVEVKKEGPPAGELSKEIAAQISPTGFQVIRGESRVVCEIWLCKQWTVKADFKPNNDILYPFSPGQLVGVAHFPRKGSDFRDQEISSGVYTLRYSLQPVDGNHVGTSPTRDFFLLVSAEVDKSPAPLDMDKLMEQSAEAAGSMHPAMLCLQQPGKGGKLAIRHNEEHDWWIVGVQGKTKAGKKEADLAIELVVVGTAAE